MKVLILILNTLAAKAIYDNKLLECYFTRSFYKHILGKMVRVVDMESEDYSFYQGLIYLMEHNVADLGYELTFSTEVSVREYWEICPKISEWITELRKRFRNRSMKRKCGVTYEIERIELCGKMRIQLIKEAAQMILSYSHLEH